MSSVIFQAAADQWKAMRAEFDSVLHAHIEAAMSATNGVLLSRRGQEAGVDPHELFARPHRSVRRYASKELLDYWQTNPRPTLAEFEEQWAGAMYEAA